MCSQIYSHYSNTNRMNGIYAEKGVGLGHVKKYNHTSSWMKVNPSQCLAALK